MVSLNVVQISIRNKIGENVMIKYILIILLVVYACSDIGYAAGNSPYTSDGTEWRLENNLLINDNTGETYSPSEAYKESLSGMSVIYDVFTNEAEGKAIEILSNKGLTVVIGKWIGRRAITGLSSGISTLLTIDSLNDVEDEEYRQTTTEDELNDKLAREEVERKKLRNLRRQQARERQARHKDKLIMMRARNLERGRATQYKRVIRSKPHATFSPVIKKDKVSAPRLDRGLDGTIKSTPKPKPMIRLKEIHTNPVNDLLPNIPLS